MATAFGSCSVAQGRIVFGTRRTKYLKALVFWTNDFFCVSKIPTIVGLSENSFKTAFTIALSQEEVCAHMTAQAKALAEVANPGIFENERLCKT